MSDNIPNGGKPIFDHDDVNEFSALWSIKAIATLGNGEFSFALKEAANFVRNHLEEFRVVPRVLTKPPYRRLCDDFVELVSNRWSDTRDGYQSDIHFSYPEDKASIDAICFFMLRYEAKKQATKRKSTADDGSSKVSPSPSSKKQARATPSKVATNDTNSQHGSDDEFGKLSPPPLKKKARATAPQARTKLKSFPQTGHNDLSKASSPLLKKGANLAVSKTGPRVYKVSKPSKEITTRLLGNEQAAEDGDTDTDMADAVTVAGPQGLMKIKKHRGDPFTAIRDANIAKTVAKAAPLAGGPQAEPGKGEARAKTENKFLQQVLTEMGNQEHTFSAIQCQHQFLQPILAKNQEHNLSEKTAGPNSKRNEEDVSQGGTDGVAGQKSTRQVGVQVLASEPSNKDTRPKTPEGKTIIVTEPAAPRFGSSLNTTLVSSRGSPTPVAPCTLFPVPASTPLKKSGTASFPTSSNKKDKTITPATEAASPNEAKGQHSKKTEHKAAMVPIPSPSPSPSHPSSEEEERPTATVYGRSDLTARGTRDMNGYGGEHEDEDGDSLFGDASDDGAPAAPAPSLADVDVVTNEARLIPAAPGTVNTVVPTNASGTRQAEASAPSGAPTNTAAPALTLAPAPGPDPAAAASITAGHMSVYLAVVIVAFPPHTAQDAVLFLPLALDSTFAFLVGAVFLRVEPAVRIALGAANTCTVLVVGTQTVLSRFSTVEDYRAIEGLWAMSMRRVRAVIEGATGDVDIEVRFSG